MRHAPSLVTRFDPYATVRRRRRRGRSIFAIIIEALHHSRRLQAERTLLQYRDLIAQADEAIRRELIARSGERGRRDE